MRHSLNPFVYQINTSQGGVPKCLVEEAWITWEGIDGDQQRNRKLHGGRDRALCLFSSELIEALRQEGHPIEAGSTGENLTLAGLVWAQLRPGDELQIGQEVRISITSYADPCRINARWFANGAYQRISQKVNPGWSRVCARVLVEGFVRRGDSIYFNEVESMVRAS